MTKFEKALRWIALQFYLFYYFYISKDAKEHRDMVIKFNKIQDKMDTEGCNFDPNNIKDI